MKRVLTFLFAAALIGAAPLAGAQRYIELKPPQPTEAGGKIDVIEFFWYGCIHCYNFEPALEGWLKTLPADAQFRRVPAVFNPRWEHDARIFYAFEALGLRRAAVDEDVPWVRSVSTMVMTSPTCAARWPEVSGA